MIQTLSAYMDKMAFENPTDVFISIPEENTYYTYSQFNERVNNLAKGLLYIGVKRNSYAGIWLTAESEILHYTFALAKIGSIVVPIHQTTQAEQLTRIIGIANLSSLIISNRSMENGYMDMLLELIPTINESERGYLKSAEFPTLNNIVCSGHLKNQGFYNTHELMLLGVHTDNLELEIVQEQVNPNDTLFAGVRVKNNQLSIKKTSQLQLLNKGISGEGVLGYY